MTNNLDVDSQKITPLTKRTTKKPLLLQSKYCHSKKEVNSFMIASRQVQRSPKNDGKRPLEAKRPTGPKSKIFCYKGPLVISIKRWPFEAN